MTYNLTYTLTNNGTEYSVTGYTGKPIDVVIPKEYNALPVTSIGDRAFKYCSSLISIEIPDSVTSIGYGAFYHCTSLASITIPNSVTSIGNYAFDGCSSLASVVIGESVTSIGDAAFNICSKLTSITIPDSVISIGDYAFRGCSKLTKVTLLAKTPASLLSTNAFSSNPTFYCFNDAIEAYKTTTNWNAFANNFVADDTRLYFTMNADAQKKYFASKKELHDLQLVLVTKKYVETLEARIAALEAAIANVATAE